MADLDEISEAIGALRAEVRELTRGSDGRGRSQHEMAVDIAVIRRDLEALKDLTASHAVALQDFQAIKQRGVGALIGAAIAGGGVATALTTLAGKLFGFKLGS